MRKLTTILRVAAISLVACMALGLAGCGTKVKDFNVSTLESILRKHNAEKLETLQDYEAAAEQSLTDEQIKNGYAYYVSVTGDDAQRMFNNKNLLYHTKTYYKVSEALYMDSAIEATETSLNATNIYLLTFETEEMAQEFMDNEITKNEGSVVLNVNKSGSKNGYRYTIRRSRGAGGGTYLNGKTLLHIVFVRQDDDDALIKEVCKEFGVMNPLTA